MDKRFVGNTLIVRMDKGEEIVGSVLRIAEEYGIKVARVSALGACGHAVVGVAKPLEKRYVAKEVSGDLEISGLTGNITRKDGVPYAHLHVTLADEFGNTYGGHLSEAVVSITCEMFIEVMDISIERQLSEENGINLMKFSE